jgi:hypothetical protein
MYAIAAGRSTTNPLHGAAFEEANLRTQRAQGSVDGHARSQGGTSLQNGSPEAESAVETDGGRDREIERRAPGEVNFPA